MTGVKNMESSNNRTLLLIDCQKGFDDPKWGVRNNPNFEENTKSLIHRWRLENQNIVHVRHSSTEDGSPLQPNAPGFEFYDWAKPMNGEKEFVKNVNSGFIGTTLEAYLRKNGITSLVIAGLTTNHCVSTTVRMAGNFGFDVELVSDACATFPRESPDGEMLDADLIHTAALASLHGEFCTVKTFSQILNNL
jgi:nicotinamidase-related amidase